MRCTRCGRILKTAAASVITKAGAAAYGPKCAAVLGLIEPVKRTTKRRNRPASDRQLPLGFEEVRL